MRLRVAIVAIGILAGIAAGVDSYTFVYAKGYSYLTNDPAACANCHVMTEYYAGWMKGPHRSVAVWSRIRWRASTATIRRPWPCA